MLDKTILILLGIWAIIFGFLTVTNFKFEMMNAIMGFSAFVLGIICVVRVLIKQA